MYISVLEELGNLDEALVQVEKLIFQASEDSLAKYLLVKGRILMQQGKKGGSSRL